MTRQQEDEQLLTDLKYCSLRKDLQWGRRIHAKVVESENDLNKYVATALIRMYAKCGSMVDARRIFDSLQNHDVVSWNVLLLGYAENGDGLVTLELFSKMKLHGCVPESVTYVAALKACSSMAVNGDDSKENWLRKGKVIHTEIGYHVNHIVQNTLIDMYVKCGSMVDAHRIFDTIKVPDVVSWNVLLLGYAENGEGTACLEMISQMKVRGDYITYVAALKACMSLALNGERALCLERGREIHSNIGCLLNHHLQSTLIDMYAKCGSISDARHVFESMKPDVVSWTSLLLGYVENGDGIAALELFSRMKESNCSPNSVTYIAALKACTSLAVNGDGRRKTHLEQGREIHLEIGPHMNHFVENTLIDMYAKFGSMTDARRVFENMHKPDVVSWNALLLGYAETGEGLTALQLFSKMKATRCKPNSVTYVASLKACKSLRDGDCLKRGREIHLEAGCHLNHFLQNTLIDMYAKCGSMVDARQIFDSIQKPDVVSWNVLLLGYAENGEGLVALKLFSRMKGHGFVPNPLTYVASLKACTFLATNGDVSRKENYLELGREIHSEIGSHLDNYVQSTLLDMYAKCGSTVEARHTFDDIQNPDVVAWTSLLLGYAENGDALVALELFSWMRVRGCIPNSVTYIAALKACGLIGNLTLGRKFHSEISDFTAHLVTCLIDFYAKCGSMGEAREAFDLHSRARNISTWNALMAGYSSFGDSVSVVNLFEAMQDQGFQPDAITFVCILLCCSHAGLVEKAREYYKAMSLQYGVAPSVMHYTCMVDILGRANQLNEAIAVIQSMPCNPDAVTWRSLLGACRKWNNVEIGRLAFQSLVNIDENDLSAYILMAHIYGNSSMWEEQESVLERSSSTSSCCG